MTSMQMKALTRLCSVTAAVIASSSAIMMGADSSTRSVSPPSLPYATATIQVTGGVSTKLSDNRLGVFPRVLVPEKGSITVRVSYSGGAPSDRVVIVAEDGGVINGSKSVETASLDAAHAVSFTFQTTGNDGLYRVLVRKGIDQNTIQFWEGKEPPLKHPAVSR